MLYDISEDLNTRPRVLTRSRSTSVSCFYSRSLADALARNDPQPYTDRNRYLPIPGWHDDGVADMFNAGIGVMTRRLAQPADAAILPSSCVSTHMANDEIAASPRKRRGSSP